MTLAERRQMCVEILLASADTSSVTLYYTLVMLAARPDLARILQAEIQDEDGGRLEKMDALLKESMRLKPVGPMILRTAEKDDEVAVDGRTMVIKAGSHLLLNVRDYHVDPDYFPDPHDIRLDRYKGAREACFMAFGHGPKSCVGQHFAMVEMKAILTEVLRHLEFSTPQDLASMQTRWDIANHPVDPATFFVRQKPADC
ncbi:unnamed protein product [Effrenium voratum]|nr:unnamed protein product [Effrenium voratum]